MKSRTFYYSKSVGIFYFVAYLLMAALSLSGLLFADLATGKKIIAGITLPVFVYLAYNTFKYDIKSAYKKKNTLKMDEKGLCLERQAITVSWDNIDRVEMSSTRHGNDIYVYVKDQDAITTSIGKNYVQGGVIISTFKYSGGEFIFDTIKTFCHEYSQNEIRFTRPQPETWPSEG